MNTLTLSKNKQKLQQGQTRLANINDDQNNEVCTKYNQCMDNRFIKQMDNDSKQNNFQIPSSILMEQIPLQIDVEPVAQTQNDGFLANLIATKNIKNMKEKQQREKLEKQRAEQQIKQRLEKLKKLSIEKRKSCPKKPLSEQKRNKWNHSIYGQKQQEKSQFALKQGQKSKREDKYQKKIQVKREKIKQVRERIKQYKQNQSKKLQNHKNKQKCQHKHHKTQKTAQQVKAEIQKRAQQIMKQMKQNKEQKETKKKITKAKINQIQKQSLKSLKKFKKRPVDSSIDFVVQINSTNKDPKQNKGINNKTQNSLAVTDSYKQKKQNKINRYRKLSNSTKSKQKNKTENLGQPRQENQEENSEQSIGKFYFWDMPIYKDDYQKIQLSERQQENKGLNTKKNKKSFGEEARQYIMQKQRQSMHQSNLQKKQKKIQDLILEKKKIFEQQFKDFQKSEKNIKEEFFWSEDQLFKQQPISNFYI